MHWFRIVTIFLYFLCQATPLNQSLLGELRDIDAKIRQIRNQGFPQYQFIKIIHSIINEGAMKIEAISSSNVYDSDGVSYPVVLRLEDSIYSLRGQKILKANERMFFSSSRNQNLFVAEVLDPEQITIKKLSFQSKNPIFSLVETLQIESKYGKVIDYENSFSLSQHFYAFTTDLGYLLMLHKGGRMAATIHLPLIQQHHAHILKLNTNLLIYTPIEIFMIGSSGKEETLRKCLIPKEMVNLTVKYDDNNWKNFYVQTGSKVYEYGYDEKGCKPTRWFQLGSDSDTFFVASTMLIVKSISNRNFYYNLTTGVIAEFSLPAQLRERNTTNTLTIVSKSFGSHIVCDIASDLRKEATEYSCYILEATLKHMEEMLQKNDFTKFRIPLVLFSLCIVIYLSIHRKNGEGASKGDEEYRELLEGEDRRLKEQVLRRRKDD